MVSQYIKDSQLVQGEFECDFVNLSTSRRMDEIGKGGVKKLLRFIGSYFTVFIKLLFHRYDLCYLAITCHGMGFLKDAPFVLLCKLFGRRVVIHQHNKGMSRCVDKQPYKWLFPLVYKNTKVILLSWFLYPDIEKVVNREQVLICPNGISALNEDVTPSASLVPLKEGQCSTNCTNKEVPRLLFLSNLIPSKGVYVLLDACKILRERNLQFVCDFVGGETKEINRATFEAAVKVRGLDDVVYYHGPKYGEEKECYWQNANIFVFPTFYYNECFPLVLLEAMQWGLPLVSSDEGGIPDVVKNGENGFVCERKDPNSLAVALEKLIKDSNLRRRMGERGYQRYKEHYTLEAFERKFIETMHKCL